MTFAPKVCGLFFFIYLREKKKRKKEKTLLEKVSYILAIYILFNYSKMKQSFN